MVPRYKDQLARIIQDNDPPPRVQSAAKDPDPDDFGTNRGPLRYVALVSIPWLDRSSHELQWGLYCLACRGGFWYRVWGQYSVETLRKHYQVIHPEKFRRIQDGKQVYTGPWRHPYLPWPE